MKQTLTLPIRILLYKDDEVWVAHCLEFDLCGHGDNKRTAIECLNRAIEIQVEHSVSFNNFQNLFSPAEGKFFEMFANSSNRAYGEVKMTLSSDDVSIEAVDAREYNPSTAEAPLACV